MRGALLAACLAVLGAPAATASEREARAALVGGAAPEFAGRLLGGGNFRLAEHRGEVVLVGFWTSWCSACRAYLSQLSRLGSTYASAGLVVVGVSLDDDPALAEGLLRAAGATVRSVFDADKTLGRAYHVGDVPLTVLVDRAGTVRYVRGEVRPRDEAELVREISRLLDE